MFIVIERTYRGQHGLLIAGHAYELSKKQIADIEDDLARTKQVFKFHEVPDLDHVNRPARKQTKTPSDKQLHGDPKTK